MCELLAVAADRPLAFGDVLPWARELERLGVAGFGWGVAWLAEDGVHRYRSPRSLAQDRPGAERVAGAVSDRFLVHLRRPSKLSTVQLADSQPFLASASDSEEGPGRFAFCHNGFLERHAELRDRYATRLRGRADSEVGFALFEDVLGDGAEPADALAEVHRRLEGSANLSYLGSDGTVAVYGGHGSNPLWTFALDGMAVAATATHSADESLFDLIFREAEDRHEIAGPAVLDPPATSGAHAAAGREATG